LRRRDGVGYGCRTRQRRDADASPRRRHRLAPRRQNDEAHRESVGLRRAHGSQQQGRDCLEEGARLRLHPPDEDAQHQR
jgi:hypothetical protein